MEMPWENTCYWLLWHSCQPEDEHVETQQWCVGAAHQKDRAAVRNRTGSEGFLIHLDLFPQLPCYDGLTIAAHFREFNFFCPFNSFYLPLNSFCNPETGMQCRSAMPAVDVFIRLIYLFISVYLLSSLLHFVHHCPLFNDLSSHSKIMVIWTTS